MTRIFISYRRTDSSGHAGRLYDRLAQQFGNDNIFMDVNTIEPGLRFDEVIEQAVSSCDALIALIGPRWLTAADAEGRRRLDNPEDFVRLEIAAALKRDVRVIPALIGGATIPPLTELPDDIKGLTLRNALRIGDRFHPDVDRLIDVLGKVVGAPAPPRPVEREPEPKPAKRRPVERGSESSPGPRGLELPGWIWGTGGVLILVIGLVVCGLGLWSIFRSDGEPSPIASGPTATPTPVVLTTPTPKPAPPTSTPISTDTPQPPTSTPSATTPTLGLQRFSIKGTVLSIDLPNWATDPVRGSITFNKDDEITNTGKLMVYLSVRNEQSTQWIESEPEDVLEIHPGEKFCSIVPAAHNSTNFWLGFQAHCASSDACSYNIEGKRLWATIGNAEVVIAPQGVQCPDR